MILSKKNRQRISAFFVGVTAIISTLFVYNNFVQNESGGFFKAALIYSIGYLAFGIFFGAVWREKSWRWAFWLISPMLILSAVSVIFGGIYPDNFLIKDLPLIFISFFAAAIGNFTGASIFSGEK